jgi:hypothetical protein
MVLVEHGCAMAYHYELSALDLFARHIHIERSIPRSNRGYEQVGGEKLSFRRGSDERRVTVAHMLFLQPPQS